jgi:phosphoribosylamine---glycine ligase
MRLLVVDPFGDGLDVAWRAQRDGHEVKHFIRDDPKYDKIGQGFVTVIRDFRPWLRWADCVFLVDNTLYMRDMDSHRREAPNVFGPSQQTTCWETDRALGQKVMQKCGIDTVPYKAFHSYDDAVAHVKKHDKPFVSKPSDEGDKALSYVAKSPEDLIYMLERWKKLGKKMDFILQDKIEGCEMAIGGFFGPHGWNAGWCENWEFKKFMNNDLGIATGEQGTVVRFVRNSKLADEMLKPLTPALHVHGYTGYIDVNCIIDDSGKPWPLEFTCRPGWPTWNIQLALLNGDSAQWMSDLVKGEDTTEWNYNAVAVGVVLSVPDYPYSHVTRREVCGIPIYGMKPGLWKHVHMAEMMLCESPVRMEGEYARVPTPATAGDYVLIMTGVAMTVKDAANTCYRRLETLTVPASPSYRTDIGRRLAKQLPKIQAKGYARGMIYNAI